MAVSSVAAQAVALIFNGTVYPLLGLMLVASIISLLIFRWGVVNFKKEQSRKGLTPRS